MLANSLMFKWFLEEYHDEPTKVRAVRGLLVKGHTGLAESVVIKNLKSKYDQLKERQPEGIKVNSGEGSYFI